MFGRSSLRITWPAVNVAGEPVLAAVSVQFHEWPTTAEPLTLFDLLSVRSDASAMAHSAANEMTPLKLTQLFVASAAPPCGVNLPAIFFHRTRRPSLMLAPVNSVGSM